MGLMTRVNVHLLGTATNKARGPRCDATSCVQYLIGDDGVVGVAVERCSLKRYGACGPDS